MVVVGDVRWCSALLAKISVEPNAVPKDTASQQSIHCLYRHLKVSYYDADDLELRVEITSLCLDHIRLIHIVSLNNHFQLKY
jgi:hypothetical protein